MELASFLACWIKFNMKKYAASTLGMHTISALSRHWARDTCGKGDFLVRQEAHSHTVVGSH